MNARHISHILPIATQIDIRAAKFLRKLTANKNVICQMFMEKAELNL